MNKTELIGKLARDSELKFTKGGTAVLKVVLATERKVKDKDGKKVVDYIPVVIWGKNAENTANYCGTKGSMLGIVGRIEISNYINKEGKKVYLTEVIADEVNFLISTKPNNTNSSSSADNGGYGGYEPIDDDGETPF